MSQIIGVNHKLLKMTTFNLKNQNRKYLYFRYVISALVLVALIAGIILVFKPSFFDQIKQKLSEDKNISQNQNQTQTPKPKQQKFITKGSVGVNSVTDSKVIDTNADSEENSIIVSTLSGKLRGKTHDVLGIKVNTFLGIPYGEPPTGKLRFRHTVPVKSWSNVRNATRLPPACIQPEYTQKLFPIKILEWNVSEDCLYMNIWSPVTNETSLPVMVWIHGGMFTIGSIGIDEYDGSVLASYGNVVVVSIQYRLGLLGFLDFETDEIPGNMGLWDQSMAIKWVNKNIANFGGDPNLVTLFGTSAGGISIGLHMMSPETKNLFKRVILQSGSSMLLSQVFGRGPKLAEQFSNMVGCLPEGTDLFDSVEMVTKCVDNMKFKKISEVQQEMVKKQSGAIPTNHSL